MAAIQWVDNCPVITLIGGEFVNIWNDDAGAAWDELLPMAKLAKLVKELQLPEKKD